MSSSHSLIWHLSTESKLRAGRSKNRIFVYREGQGLFFTFLAVPRPVLEPIEPACQWMSLAFFMVVKRTGLEAHRSTSSTKASHTSI